MNTHMLFVFDKNSDLQTSKIPFFDEKRHAAAAFGLYSSSPSKLAKELTTLLQQYASAYNNPFNQIHFLISEYAFLPDVLHSIEQTITSLKAVVTSDQTIINIWVYEQSNGEISAFHRVHQDTSGA